MRKEFKATFIGGASKKFYTLRLEDKELIRQWGRIGTMGQMKNETFGSPAQAEREFEELKNKKLAKGYKEVDIDGLGEEGSFIEKDRYEEAICEAAAKAKGSLIKLRKYPTPKKEKFKLGDKVIIKGDSCGIGHRFSKGDIGKIMEIGEHTVHVKVEGAPRSSWWVDFEDLELYDESCDY